MSLSVVSVQALMSICLASRCRCAKEPLRQNGIAQLSCTTKGAEAVAGQL